MKRMLALLLVLIMMTFSAASFAKDQTRACDRDRDPIYDKQQTHLHLRDCDLDCEPDQIRDRLGGKWTK
ncbi:MAG: hypothetical protein GT601_17375 [Acidaminobacter sp.]|uniref:hypothetical protein n=1 Tax=Acidaminobacter sp. TaxID=1872102 RepID=UPI00137F7BFB|nr:hypothetical protein [Acidaminobacter sp.]MZQ99440.1 hypothetical protein [Acidaminobacter sp.]